MLVASGFGAGVLGWMFSVGMGVAVFVTSYYSRVAISAKDGKEDKRSIRVRTIAMTGLLFFVVIDGYFNVVEVLRTLLIPDLYYPALVYGAFPTVAAALLGILQGYVDRLPVPPTNRTYNIWNAIRARIVRKLDSSIRPTAITGENIGENIPVAQSDTAPYDQFYEWLNRNKVDNPPQA
jgi:hypothetical protein